jgi:hypothetical protein
MLFVCLCALCSYQFDAEIVWLAARKQGAAIWVIPDPRLLTFRLHSLPVWLGGFIPTNWVSFISAFGADTALRTSCCGFYQTSNHCGRHVERIQWLYTNLGWVGGNALHYKPQGNLACIYHLSHSILQEDMRSQSVFCAVRDDRDMYKAIFCLLALPHSRGSKGQQTHPQQQQVNIRWRRNCMYNFCSNSNAFSL